jgi:hypothetical protein
LRACGPRVGATPAWVFTALFPKEEEGNAMRNVFVVLTAMVVSLATLSAREADGQEKKPADDTEKSSAWMKAKLQLSQEVLAGLTKADFEKIRTNAEAMSFLGYLERYAKADTPGYKPQVVLFDVATKELIRQSKEKNVAGATLAYNQLTVSCVQCHSIVRDAKK